MELSPCAYHSPENSSESTDHSVPRTPVIWHHSLSRHSDQHDLSGPFSQTSNLSSPLGPVGVPSLPSANSSPSVHPFSPYTSFMPLTSIFSHFNSPRSQGPPTPGFASQPILGSPVIWSTPRMTARGLLIIQNEDSRSQDGGLNISREHQVPASLDLNLTQLSASPFSPPQISSQRIAGGGGDVRGIDVTLKPNVTGVDTETRLELTHDVSNAMDSSDSKEFEDDDDGSLQGRSEILTPLRKSRIILARPGGILTGSRSSVTSAASDRPAPATNNELDALFLSEDAQDGISEETSQASTFTRTWSGRFLDSYTASTLDDIDLVTMHGEECGGDNDDSSNESKAVINHKDDEDSNSSSSLSEPASEPNELKTGGTIGVGDGGETETVVEDYRSIRTTTVSSPGNAAVCGDPPPVEIAKSGIGIASNRQTASGSRSTSRGLFDGRKTSNCGEGEGRSASNLLDSSSLKGLMFSSDEEDEGDD